MVEIRLSRTGKKHKPSYRVVVSEARTKRDGKILETIGFYNPKSKPPVVKISKERVNYWLSCGAQLTPAVKKLI